MTKVKKPAVKAKSKRRGRPLGSKNKPKGLEKQTANWEAEPRQPAVDFKKLAERLQHALAKSYVEAQDLEKKLEMANIWLKIKQTRIDDCERLLAQAVQAGDIELDYEDLLDENAPV